MESTSTRERLMTAAFRLFSERGYEQTTVDEIAAAAGLGRTTFFRHFPTKEAVIFPDHERIQAAVDARLRTASAATADIALLEGAQIVLEGYLADGEMARARYALTRSVPALRSVEAAGQRGYQQVFHRHLRGWLVEGGPAAPTTTEDPDEDPGELLAEVLANAVVTAHNHVLRRWLRGVTDDPRRELARAIAAVTQRLGTAGNTTSAGAGSDAGTQIVVLRTDQDLESLLPRLRAVIAPEAPRNNPTAP